MAHRPSHSTSRASLDASYADISMASFVAPSDAGSESLSEASGTQLGPNKNAVAYLVYHNRGDPRSAGYKQPTTREIPQVKLPRVHSVDALEVDAYLKELKTFDRHVSPAADSGPSPPPLDSVPSVFFDSDFHLDNPRVFDAVMGEDSSILQEKLSWYVDVVEAHLEREIAAASSQFFSVTASFHDIEEQAAILADRIASFKPVIDGIQTDVVTHFEQTAKLQKKLKDIDVLLSALDQLLQFTKAVDSLPVEDPSAVLASVASARRIATQGIDLSRVSVTNVYFERLDAAETQARNDAASLFVNALLADLRNAPRHSADIETSMALAEQTGVKAKALADYADAVDLEIRALVVKQLPGAMDDESQGLARSLHRLTSEEAKTMSNSLFSTLHKALVKLQKQPIPPSIIQDAVEGVDNRLVRVLRVRKDHATVLSVGEFLQFYHEVDKFYTNCESISNTQLTELRELLVAQTKLYIHALHNSREEDLMKAMDADDWRTAEISPQVQIAASIISSAGSIDPSEWELTSAGTKPTGTSRIVVDGQSYAVSKSTQVLVGSVVKYLQLICALPDFHVSGIAMALQELLRAFNNKAHNLILGFGARITAGLKHISVKNLLLTAESLRLFYNLISSVKRCTERHLSSSSSSSVTDVLDAFDNVQQSYFDHRAEIESKLVKLMNDKVISYARQIATVDWSVRQPEANKYMQNLMSDTMRVSRVAQEMLPQQLAQNIVAAIFSAYKPALLEAYGEITVKNADEKENVLRDLRFFKTKELAFNGQSRSGDVIYESVKMFVGPDLPEREPDLDTVSTITSPRASTESSMAVDARQAFASALAQSNAQAEVGNALRNSTNGRPMNGNLAGSRRVNDAEGEAVNQVEIIRETNVNTDVRQEDTQTRPQADGNINANNESDTQQAENSEFSDQKEIKSKQVTDASSMAEDGELEDQVVNEETEANQNAEESKHVAEEAEAKRVTEETDAKRVAEEAEAKRVAEETEAKRKAEEAEAKREEAEAKRVAEEAEAKRKAEEAEAKRVAEEAEAKRKAEEAEAKRVAEETEAKRKAEEVEVKRVAEETEAKRKAEEAEAKRVAEEAEAKRVAEEAEAKRVAEETEAKRKAEEAEAKRVAEETEAKRVAEETEAKRKAEEAEAKRVAEEAEAKRVAEETEAKRIAEETEAKRKAEEAEAKKVAEEAKKAELSQAKPILEEGKDSEQKREDSAIEQNEDRSESNPPECKINNLDVSEPIANASVDGSGSTDSEKKNSESQKYGTENTTPSEKKTASSSSANKNRKKKNNKKKRKT